MVNLGEVVAEKSLRRSEVKNISQGPDELRLDSLPLKGEGRVREQVPRLIRHPSPVQTKSLKLIQRDP